MTRAISAAESGNLPSVSFLKAATYQQAHAAYSNPLDEQTYLVNTINRLHGIPQWNNTAVIITYDDSGGWYDHVMPPIVGCRFLAVLSVLTLLT
jgi:phospholipase C